jgi:hypothetical protein
MLKIRRKDVGDIKEDVRDNREGGQISRRCVIQITEKAVRDNCSIPRG